MRPKCLKTWGKCQDAKALSLPGDARGRHVCGRRLPHPGPCVCSNCGTTSDGRETR